MSDTATKQDVQEIVDKSVNKAVTELSEIIQDFATQVDKRFDKLETDVAKLQSDMNSVLNQLDSIEKDIAISEDERAVMSMQLTRLHDWVEKAAARIDVEFVH